MENIQIAYGLRIDGLQFNETNFSDVTPEFKNIVLTPDESKEDFYELLIYKKSILNNYARFKTDF